MRLLSALDTKVLRDVKEMRGQLTAIAFVIACGVGVYLGMRGTLRSLESARSTYYAHERFADVFASLKRAPRDVERRLRAIPGVQAVQTRVVADVTLDVPGMEEAATGRLVSLPDDGRPAVNDVRVRSGRLPAPGEWDEVLASEAFALAHGMRLGAEISAVINGRHETLRIVGTALSPEFTYALAPGQIFPDDRRFGVLWMRRGALAPAFDLEGAFNDVALRTARGTHVERVIEEVDGVLARFGGIGAFARRDQQSAFFLENELTQLRTLGLMTPLLFLAVAGFLLHVVFGRVVAGQRGEIAVLKAFGYSDREVGLHYAKLVGVVLAGGCALGAALALWVGVGMTRLYAEYYRFPELPLRLGARDVVEGLGISALAATAGTAASIRRTVCLPPAEAMRPEAPAAYRPTVIERLGLARWLPVAPRIVLREVERSPARAAMSVIGIAMATGLTIMNSFTFDSVRHMLNVQFAISQRDDVQLTLFEPRSTGALSALESLPGVMHAEPFRTVPVKLIAGSREKSAAITGIPRDTTLSALLDVHLRDVPLPSGGLVLSRKLAEILGVARGESLRVEVLEGARRETDVRVARVVETFIGISAHMELSALCALVGEPASLNGAWLMVDDARLPELHRAVKETPVVGGIVARDSALASVQKVLDEGLGTWIAVSLGFSLVMAFGVLYNAARTTLAERARELASLRVLGFRRREVAAILLGELGVLVAVAVPLGLLFGRSLAALMVRSPGFDTEQFRLPLVISPATYAMAVLTVVAAAVVSGWSAWRKLDRFDIVEVLKTRD